MDEEKRVSKAKSLSTENMGAILITALVALYALSVIRPWYPIGQPIVIDEVVMPNGDTILYTQRRIGWYDGFFKGRYIKPAGYDYWICQPLSPDGPFWTNMKIVVSDDGVTANVIQDGKKISSINAPPRYFGAATPTGIVRGDPRSAHHVFDNTFDWERFLREYPVARDAP